MLKELNWGILSTARINRAVIPGLKISPRNHLLAVASRNKDRAQEYARTWEIPRAYGSYEELIADPDIQAVYISLPNHLHEEWTVRACEVGKHVLCEKPIALSVQELDSIQNAAQKNHVVVAEAFMYRHHPQAEKVEEIVKSGMLGEIRLMRGTFTYLLTRPHDYRWTLEQGGGSLWDVGGYSASYAQLVMGEPPVEVFGYQVSGPSGIDLVFSGELRFANGALAQISTSCVLPYHVGFQVRGSQASLFIPQPFRPVPDSKIIVTKDDQEEIIKFPMVDSYLGEVENLADAVLEHKPPRLTLDESRQILVTLSALLQSAREGRPIRLG